MKPSIHYLVVCLDFNKNKLSYIFVTPDKSLAETYQRTNETDSNYISIKELPLV